MQIVLGPVLTRKGGYAFDCWTPEKGLSRGYIYGRIEDAHYARNVEIRSSDQTCPLRAKRRDQKFGSDDRLQHSG